MQKKLKSILLLDDNLATNFIHKKFLQKANCAEQIIDFRSGINALKYLTQQGIRQPDMIMVDINMPIMSAWEFLELYENSRQITKTDTTIVLLSTSLSPADKEKADNTPVIKEVLLKPLSVESIQQTIDKHFNK